MKLHLNAFLNTDTISHSKKMWWWLVLHLVVSDFSHYAQYTKHCEKTFLHEQKKGGLITIQAMWNRESSTFNWQCDFGNFTNDYDWHKCYNFSHNNNDCITLSVLNSRISFQKTIQSIRIGRCFPFIQWQ